MQPRASLSPILHYRLAELEDGGGTLVAVMEQRWVCLVRPPLAAHLVVGVAMLAGEDVVDSYKTLLAGSVPPMSVVMSMRGRSLTGAGSVSPCCIALLLSNGF